MCQTVAKAIKKRKAQLEDEEEPGVLLDGGQLGWVSWLLHGNSQSTSGMASSSHQARSLVGHSPHYSLLNPLLADSTHLSHGPWS